MAFFFITLGFLYVGRKLGWALSKSLLYSVSMAGCIAICVVWGVAVAATMRGLIDWRQPSIILRWVMGYALGAYVSVPNFGLFNESTIPPQAQNRHMLISTVPSLVYIVCSIAFAFLLPHAIRGHA